MLLYLLKASILLLVLYLFYKWALEKESFFASNRFYLLGSLILCFVLPFISLPEVSEHQGIVTQTWKKLEYEEPSPVSTTPVVSELAPSNSFSEPATYSTATPTPLPQPQVEQPATEPVIKPTEAPASTYAWTDCLLLIYGFGVAIFFLQLVSQIVSLLWRILRSTDKIMDDDHTIINVAGEQAPCSFFR